MGRHDDYQMNSKVDTGLLNLADELIQRMEQLE